MFCIKKKFLAIFAAAAICLTGCGGNDTPEQPQETTKVENVYETLAEGQERGWKVKDVLKNDLEIDGIPISIPCTIDDFLNALGDEYSIDRSGLLYNGELTVLRIFTDPD
ncbi:MAG: hypothetical protein J1E40_06100, partial [Oscillospiraceae bacterium]|nr:hypothetical protein [Oscillospiraceae bacterium]